MSNIVDKITAEAAQGKKAPAIEIGDTVQVHIRIKEGDKERIQVFGGTVIARAGRGAAETFTVRRISFGVGVEKVFPMYSPSVAKVVVQHAAKVRRAKLYYLRGLQGKKARLRERVLEARD
jgi:large subunit ribosomal protein L19